MLKTKKILNNKKAESISITVLVVMTVILCVSAIFVFSFFDRNVDKDISGFGALSGFYHDRTIFINYLQSLGETTVSQLKDSGKEVTTEVFIQEFKRKYAQDRGNSQLPLDYLRIFRSQIEDNSKYDVKISASGSKQILTLSFKDFEFQERFNPKEYNNMMSITSKGDISLSFEI